MIPLERYLVRFLTYYPDRKIGEIPATRNPATCFYGMHKIVRRLRKLQLLSQSKKEVIYFSDLLLTG